MRELSSRPFREGFGFLEGPRWRDGRLWVSDIACKQVLCLDADGQTIEALPTPGRPSGLGWLPDGDLLVALMDHRTLLRRRGHEWEVHADLSRLTGADINDMVVSSQGMAYVTGIGYAEEEERRSTGVILVRPDGSATMQSGELWRPNGCVITPDQKTFLVAETRVHRLSRFTIGADGSLSNHQIVATLPAGSWADGMCLDVDGALWIADPKRRRCVRLAANGVLTDVIDTVPTPCIACTLGGPHGRTLYLLLSELGDMAELADRSKGRIEVATVEVPGAGSP